MRAILVVAVALAASFAGCANGGTGQSYAGEGQLAFNGSGAGTEGPRGFECDGTGTLQVGANIGSGSLTVTVKDAAGKTLYTKTLTGPGQSADSKTLTGGAGTWSLQGQRNSQFTGQYSANVSC